MTAMNDEREPRESISDYERAVCYYTLPRTTSPVNLALIFVYALCLIEAVAALVYGLATDNETWTTVGTVCLGGIVLLGVVAFTVRAFQNELRRRRALAEAERTPEPHDVAIDVPDPFAAHLLLVRPLEKADEYHFPITDREGRPVYVVHLENDRRYRRVTDPEGHEVLRAHIAWRTGSFMLEGMLPRSADIFAGETQIGRFRRRFALGASVVDLECRGSQAARYTLRDGGLFRGNLLVGRIYVLRDQLFLDVERGDCTNVLLALFACLNFEKARAAIF